MSHLLAHRFEFKRLMVIIPDQLSALIHKGEVIDRYYNPGELFEEVHIVLMNDDRPDEKLVQPMVGDAQLHIHNIPLKRLSLVRNVIGRSLFLRSLVSQHLALAKTISPDVVRSHGSELVLYFSHLTSSYLKVPWVASLHNNPDFLKFISPIGRVRRYFDIALCRRYLPEASEVIAVYQAILPFLYSIGVRAPTLAYNMVAVPPSSQKTDYTLNDLPKLLTVGRMIPGKSPLPIIEALDGIPNATLTIVGDGPLREVVEQRASALGMSQRVQFIPRMGNDELCRILPTFDVFLAACEFPGIPKAIMEPFLAGLPIVINEPPSEFPSEYISGTCLITDGTAQGYRNAIMELLKDGARRQEIGRAAARWANSVWNPDLAERRVVALYRSLVSRKKTT